MPHPQTKTLYYFAELNDKAKERARDWWREAEGRSGDQDWAEYIIEDAETIAGLLGIELQYPTGGKTRTPAIYWRGFSSQGDGACFVGKYSYAKSCVKNVIAHAPQDADLRSIAVNLQAWQRPHFYKLYATVTHTGHYSHEYSVTIDVDTDGRRLLDDETIKGISDELRAFMRWIYRSLEREYDYHLSDEHVDESIIANEYEFTEDGRRAC
jgi:hypothetical protein